MGCFTSTGRWQSFMPIHLQIHYPVLLTLQIDVQRRQFAYKGIICSFCSSDQVRSRSEMSGSVILFSNLICGIELGV